MYKCKSEQCKDMQLRYSDAWVAGCYADGSPGNICKHCNSELIEINEESVSKVKLNTYGCTPSSNPFTH